MSAMGRRLVAAPGWTQIEVGTTRVAVAERDALGTSARVAAWPPYNLVRSLAVVDTELAYLDLQASRFRDDSEISAVHRSGTDVHLLSEGLAEAIAVALMAARWTGGLVDPTVGSALESLGYDRDFAAVRQAEAVTPAPAPVPGWQAVRLDGRRLRLPRGVHLDLGATAKGLGADRAASAAASVLAGGGVLVSLGGDIAVAGEAPNGGWPVSVTDAQEPASDDTGPVGAQHLATGPALERPSAQVVWLAAGALATSSISCRRWRRGGRVLHHILDPRTGLPAAGPWRTVSVAAASCAEANAASTAAVVAGELAEAWLAAQGLPARLVAIDGTVRFTGGWPETEGGVVQPPKTGRMPAGPVGLAATVPIARGPGGRRAADGTSEPDGSEPA